MKRMNTQVRILSVSMLALGCFALAMQDAPKKGGGGGRGGNRKPPQDGVVKPAMSDTIHGSVYADNWFAMYINGKLVAVDSIDFLPHNVV